MKKKVMAMFMIFILTWAFSASVNASEIFKASNDPVIESVERFFDFKAQNFHTESQKNTRSIRLPEISISEQYRKIWKKEVNL